MIFSPLGTALLPFLAFPITYGYNYILKQTNDHRVVFGVAVGIMALIGLLFFLASKLSAQRSRPKDPLYYVFTLFAFTGMVDLITSLEIDRFIQGFMEVYLKEGEPYLKTAHCTLACYYDGTVHLVMYVVLAVRCLQNQDNRNLGLYWCGSMANIVLVFLLGNVIGKYSDDVKMSYLLTIPYMIVPVVVAMVLMRRPRRQMKLNKEQVKFIQEQDILTRPLDILLITYLLFAIFIASLRGLAALDCTWPSVQGYLARFEPYIGDPVGYPRIQMLMYLLYYVPYYAATICGLVIPGQEWMLDWSILHAGATSQAQVIHICASFHKRTLSSFRPPPPGRKGFLLVNMSLQLVPQILAWRCNGRPEFFSKISVDDTNKKDA